MVTLVAEFFNILGLSPSAPSSLGELIPYLLTVFIGVCMISACFAVIGKVIDLILDFTRWR